MSIFDFLTTPSDVLKSCIHVFITIKYILALIDNAKVLVPEVPKLKKKQKNKKTNKQTSKPKQF